MISAYNSLITYGGEDWEDYLDRIALIDIFGGLLKEYPDKADFTCVVKYILLAYSCESEMLIIGADWLKTKQKIFEKASIKPNEKFYEDLVHLKNRVIISTIEKWLSYQENDTFTMLQTLKDLKVEMQVSCLTDIKKTSDEIDYTQKFLNAEYCIKLKSMIKDLESELIQSSPALKDSVKEFREASRSSKSFGSETFLKD
jgi:hypothetical protein